jgi:hypothetical protein
MLAAKMRNKRPERIAGASSGGSIAPSLPAGRSWATCGIPGRQPLGRIERRLHLDTSPEEMGDGDPQMAVAPAAMAGAVVARYDALSSACGVRGQEETLQSKQQAS